VCANKLGVSDFESWARSELDGYENSVPDYRKLSGHVRAQTQYHGVQNVRFRSHEMQEIVSQLPFGFPLGEIQQMLAQTTSNEIGMTYPPKAEQLLLRDMNTQDVKPILAVPKSSVAGILDAVRNIVLNWALELEKRGVNGVGMSFSDVDRKQASTIHIGTLIQGNVQQAAIQQNTSGSVQSVLISQVDLVALRQFITAVADAVGTTNATTPDAIRELMAEIIALRAQVESPRPKPSVVKECVKSAREILQGTAGELLAQHAGTLIRMATALLGS